MVDAFSPFDAADYLSAFDGAAAYLQAVTEETGDDPALIAQALGAIARRAGTSREGLHKALSADGD